ncbi:hypothetical protein COS66_00880 [Candidatus Berkelbacteria bacterium CG06_land_8_20_14_3_00_43_10]|nr:MAG: hypothetical protein COS66_00880 [Candidatus Berkelbacteria bacterium CG06_land_8_20_14_3_00_43_10]
MKLNHYTRAHQPRKHRELWKQLKKRNWLKLFGKGLLGFAIILVLLFVWFSKDLPTPNSIEKKLNVASTKILDRNGEMLYAVSGDKKRLVIPFSEIPDNVKKATVAVEDQNFYKHFGVDFKGIARSVIVDITRGGAKQGGSTITQQFVKNALLDPKKTFSRKIKEVILSIEIEAIYPKDKILELYLNEIPYGSTSYGIESASRSYFGKPAKELSLAQAATLAALPQAPTYYSPYGQNKDALLKRKDFVLDKMAKIDMITQADADSAKAEAIVFIPRKDSIIAPHFVFYIEQLIADKYGEEALQNGGLTVTTSLDLKVQKMAEEAVSNGSKKLEKYGANNAALIATDPKTGQVLAMVGSKDYFDNDIQGQVNVTTSERQPGSSFKPIVYATAFKDKFNPAYPLFDLTTDFGNYTPHNYDGNTHGPVSMRTALANSLNIPAVKTLSLAGLKNALTTASDLGITTLTKPDRYGLALVLGGGEVKPIEMANAFAVFGNGGKYNPIAPILKVTDRDNTVLEEYKDAHNKQVLDPQVAYLVSNILSDTEARKMVFGFTNSLTIPGHSVAVKTGTTSEYHDAWTVGYTPQIATAVWTGNTDNKAMKSGADGSVIAAPIWNNFMRMYLSTVENVEFERPAGIADVAVDFLSNKLPTDSSPQDGVRTDVFASWQIPSQKDDIHVKVKINKLNSKLATDQTPADLVEEHTYTVIHSERPDVSSWESPVQGWAQENGMNNAPPTDKDDSYTLASVPVVTLQKPVAGDKVSKSFEITADAVAQYGIKDIVFHVDETDVGLVTGAPYKVVVDASKFSVGDHSVSATIRDANGVMGQSAKVSITIVASTAGPTITNIAVVPTSTTASFTWTTDVNAVSKVVYGVSSTALTSSSVESTKPGVTHTIQIGGLLPNTQYFFQALSTDSAGYPARSPIGNFLTKTTL